MRKSKRGLVVVISGPSGVGKSSVVAQLLKKSKDFKLSISASTRPSRPMEEQGKHYYFLTQDEFFDKVKKDEFLEWAQVHGSYYGTPKSYIKENIEKGYTVILEVDVQGAANMKNIAEKGAFKNIPIVFIFLIPPSVDILAFRLKRRKTEHAEEVNYRLRAAIAELQVMEKYDYIVVNDKIESAAQKIYAIIKVEKERTFLN